jgi:hypothetical protein
MGFLIILESLLCEGSTGGSLQIALKIQRLFLICEHQICFHLPGFELIRVCILSVIM